MAARGPTRWDVLFADLEAQLAAHEQAARDGEIAELTRAEQASISLADRLRASVGAATSVELPDGEVVSGMLRTVASGWLLLEGRGASGITEHLVPAAAVCAVTGVSRQGRPSASRLDTLGLGTPLRVLQRDRARVVVRTASGPTTGRVARVGEDHLDLEEIDRVPVRVRTVPFDAVLCVSRA